MPSCSATPSDEYIAMNIKKRKAYRKKLLAKGIVDNSSKMHQLMCRKFH